MQPSKTILRLLAVSACMLFAAGCKGKVEQVKNHIWEGDKGLTLGKALDNYKGFEKKNWEVKKTENGKEFVEFTGVLPPNEQKLKESDTLTKRITEIKNQLANKNVKIINDYSGYMGKAHIEQYLYEGAYIDNSYDAFDNSDKAIAERAVVIEGMLQPYLNKSLALNEFYKNGNKMEVVYQFTINEDKSIDISTSGCRTSKDKKASELSEPFAVLKSIYDNKPIVGVCAEPV